MNDKVQQVDDRLNGRSVDDDEIDLLELWQHLVDAKWLIAAITSATFVLGFVYAVTATSYYEVKASLMDNSGASSKSSGLGGLGALAGIAGVGLPASPIEAVVTQAKSNQILLEFLHKHDLKKVFFSGRWDEENQQWLPASGIVNTLWGEGLRPILMGEKPQVNSPYPLMDNEPSWQSLLNTVRDRNYFSISLDAKTNMVSMSVLWTNPNQAEQWLNLWIADVNEALRQNAINDAELMLSGLMPKLEQSMPAEVRASIISMVDEQSKIVNTAELKKDYALKVIDPPMAPEAVAKPKRVLILAVSLVLGFMMGAMFAIVRGSIRKRKAEHSESLV